jgi:hypothetical protein
MKCFRWLGFHALGGGADGFAQSRRRVASYDVMVPAKNFGTVGAIAIN